MSSSDVACGSDDDEHGVERQPKHHRHQSAVSCGAVASGWPTDTRWAIGEAARAVFSKFAGESDVMQGDDLARFAASLGWPEQPSPAFLLCAFSVYRHSTAGNRSVICLEREPWVAAFQDLGSADPGIAAERLWCQVRDDFNANTRGTGIFLEFYKFVFVFQLVQHAATLPRTSADSHSCVTPSSQLYGTFLRAVPTISAKRGLVAAVGQLSPHVMSFCAFLDATHVRKITLDQWLNFVVFSRAHRGVTISARHQLDDSWSSLVEAYVDWLRNSFAQPGVAWRTTTISQHCGRSAPAHVAERPDVVAHEAFQEAESRTLHHLAGPSARRHRREDP